MNKSVKQPIKPSVLMPKKDPSRLLLISGAAAALIGGGAIAGWFLVVKPQQEASLPTGVGVIPANVLMTVSVSTNPAQWQQLRALGTTQSRAVLDQNLTQLRDRLFTKNGLDYAQDIQPWVGQEVTLAFLPAAATSDAKQPTSPTLAAPGQAIAAVLPIANPIQALQILKKSQSGSQWTERTYQGIQIRERQGKTTPALSTSVLENQFLVVTTTPKLMEQVIDASKTGVSVADTPGYQQVWDSIKTEPILAKIFVNVPAAAKAVAAGGLSPVTPESLAQRQQNQGFASSVSLTASGLSFQGISWLKPDSERSLLVQNNARIIPSLLPASTYMMASGSDLKQLWQDYGQGAQTNPVAPIPPEQLRDGLKSLTGLDFEKDFLAWMGGEYALAFVPAPASAARTSGTGIALLAQASDRRAGEDFFQKLDQAVSSRHQFQVKPDTVNGQSVTTWSDAAGRLIASHGWLENNVAFFTAGAAITDTLVPRPKTTLADSALFTKAVPTGLKPNNGHFFLNVSQTINHPMPLLPFLPSGNPLVQAIDTIGVTAAVRDTYSTRFDIWVQLQKSGTVQPLPNPGVSLQENPKNSSPTPSPQ
jgi:hypothetical protein